MPVPNGDYELRVTDRESGWTARYPVRMPRDRLLEVEFRVPTAPLDVEVQDPDGVPFVGSLEVTLASRPRGSDFAVRHGMVHLGEGSLGDDAFGTVPVVSTTRRVAGPRFRVERKSGAAIRVEVQDAAGLRAARWAFPEGSGPLVLRLAERSTARIRVLHGGRPAPEGAKVRAITWGAMSHPSWTASVDAEGRADFASMEQAPAYALLLFLGGAEPGTAPDAVSLIEDEEEARFAWSRMRTELGLAIDFECRAPRTWRVEPTGGVENRPGSLALWLLTSLEPSGARPPAAPLGEWSVGDDGTVLLPGIALHPFVEITSGMPDAGVRWIADASDGTLRGHSRELSGAVSSEGKAIQGAQVDWAPAREGVGFRAFRRSRVLSDLAGRFAIRTDGDGQGVVRVSADGYRTRTWTVDLATPLPVSLVLTPVGTRTIRLSGGEGMGPAHVTVAGRGSFRELVSGATEFEAFEGDGPYTIRIAFREQGVDFWETRSLAGDSGLELSVPPLREQRVAVTAPPDLGPLTLMVRAFLSDGADRLTMVAVGDVENGVATVRLPTDTTTVLLSVVGGDSGSVPGTAAPCVEYWRWSGPATEVPASVELSETNGASVEVQPSGHEGVLVFSVGSTWRKVVTVLEAGPPLDVRMPPMKPPLMVGP